MTLEMIPSNWGGQETFLSWSWKWSCLGWRSKGYPLLWSWFGFGMMIKGIFSSSIIWNWNDDQGDLFYLDNQALKWWSKGSPLPQSGFALKWWSKGSPLPRSGFEMMIKGISFTSIWLWNDDQRDLPYFDNLELKWWSMGSPLPQSGFGMMIKGISSTLIIWNWNDDQGGLLYLDLDLEWWSMGSHLPRSGFAFCKKSKF